MRAERFAPAPPSGPSIGPVTMILAAIGCFTVGFMALMAFPRLWPKYVQTPSVAAAEPAGPVVIGSAVAAPLPQIYAATPGVVTEIKPAAARPMPQKVQAVGSLASLAECKAAIRAGDTYESVGPDQMAAMLGMRGRALTSAQIDAGCRKLTE